MTQPRSLWAVNYPAISDEHLEALQLWRCDILVSVQGDVRNHRTNG